MAINKKLIHFKSKQKFNEELANGNILDTSIVFIYDTQEIYTHGLLYDGSKVDVSKLEETISKIKTEGAGFKFLNDKGEYEYPYIVVHSFDELLNLEAPLGAIAVVYTEEIIESGVLADIIENEDEGITPTDGVFYVKEIISGVKIGDSEDTVVTNNLESSIFKNITLTVGFNSSGNLVNVSYYDSHLGDSLYIIYNGYSKDYLPAGLKIEISDIVNYTEQDLLLLEILAPVLKIKYYKQNLDLQHFQNIGVTWQSFTLKKCVDIVSNPVVLLPIPISANRTILEDSFGTLIHTLTIIGDSLTLLEVTYSGSPLSLDIGSSSAHLMTLLEGRPIIGAIPFTLDFNNFLLIFDLSVETTQIDIATVEDIADMETKTNAAATYLPIGDYATKTELPTKISELQDDKGFLIGEETSDALDDVETNVYVKYVAQTLTEEQQKQARLNIGLNEISNINYDLNVKAINHRGYSYESPENTIPAYIMSKDKGFTYVEGDVAFTKDNVAVLLHDNTIDRTSNGSGKITDFNYQELLQYDFGSWFSSEYEGVRIPTFKEWILLCKNLGLHPYIELKSSGSYTQAQITQVVNEVAACGMKGKVTYISFNSTFLGYVKNADASARLGFLTSTLASGNITTAKNLKTTSNEVFLDAKLATLKDSVVDSCISNNIPLEVWTVNTENEIIKMHSYISGVTSDYLVAGRTLYNNALVYVPPVSSWVPTTGISLDKTSLTFSSFDTITLVATVEPSNSSEEIVWKSSNTSIATVVNGVVTPIADGSCVITVTSGDFSDSCSVNIAFTRYNITRNLTGCSLSNTEDNVLISKAYYGEIIPNEGYSLKNGTVKITMGGVDITSSAYSNGIINIENVTGDIVVTVACVAVPVYSITRNLVGCTSDKNTATIGEGNPYNETFAALENYRLSGATIAITMGDADISSMYNDGVLSIPEVTGNIVININAEVIPVYSITRNLVNCSTDSSVNTIKEGESHNENILANEGYTLRGGNIVITMGGIDISSSLSNTGTLSINAVTGNIVINIEAVEYNSVLPIVDLDLDNVGTDGVIRNIGTGGSTYDATIQTTSTSDTFSASAGTGLTLNNHAYANIPYVLKGTDNFTIICKGKIATKSSQTYQRLFRTDTDAPSWYYSKSNTKLQAKLSGKNSSESTISVLGSLIAGMTGTNNGGNSVIFNTDTTTVREVMFTCDGTDIKLYINGQLSASQPASGLTETAYIGIGDNNPDSKYYAKGLEINRFAIYDSVITNSNIDIPDLVIRLTSENLSQGAISAKNVSVGTATLISPYRTNMSARASTAADLSILVNGGKTVSVEAKDKNGNAMQVGIQTFGDDALEALSNEESMYPYIIDSGWIASGGSYQIPITHKYAWIVVSYSNTSTTVNANNIDYIQITEVNS